MKHRFNWTAGVTQAKRKTLSFNVIPIVPSSGLYLRIADGNEGPALEEDVRLATRFRMVWRSLPLGARRKMVNYWRTPNEVAAKEYWSPIIYLWDKAASAREGRGIVFDEQHTIVFDTESVRLMRDDQLDVLIAHELGHCYLTAIDDPTWDDEIVVVEMVWHWWNYDDELIDEFNAVQNKRKANETQQLATYK